MLATVTAVNVEKAPRGYSIANVSFERDGKSETRKIMSFGGSATAFSQLVELKEFPVAVNITMEKNAKGFWEWKGIEKGQSNVGANSSAGVGSKSSGKVLGSNYETSEERARRQVYIVRQSSISSAIEYLKAKAPKGVEDGVKEVLEVAKDFENYVMDVDLNAAFDDKVL